MTATSYRDSSGLVSRANSALLRIDMIQADRSLPSEVRLVLIAQVMAGEPVLTDESSAAYGARAAAASRSRRKVSARV